MIRIAIVDDEREILELLFRIIDDTLKREQAQFEITTFLKAEELLSSHREKPFQIIFADLEMPDVDGLHLAAELRKEDQHTLLIFVTNHDELVFQCFQYEVFNFIRKDFLESELPLAVAYQKVWNHTSKLQLKSKTGLLSLAADDVVYFVSENHTIMMCEKENTKVQVMYTMEKLEKLLPQNQFVRCHAGYIVNCFYVFSINPNEILLTTGERIPLSRHRKKEMKSVFQQYLRGI
jgi:DNA-binding LytR/AlgR family response regulator